MEKEGRTKEGVKEGVVTGVFNEAAFVSMLGAFEASRDAAKEDFEAARLKGLLPTLAAAAAANGLILE